MLDNINAVMLAAANGLNWEVRQGVLIAFSVLMLVACIAIVVVIMLQKGTNDNIGVVGGASDTFYGKNKEKTKEGILKKVTLGLFVFIFVCAIICFAVGIAD